MVLPCPAQILVGLSLDPDDSKELLSWAIRVLANPNDTIVAVHVLVAADKKKRVSVRRRQSQLRQAKAYVISVLGEFAQSSWSKQVNLEARVALNSTVGEGLVEEVKSINADYLLIRGSRNRTNKYELSDVIRITKYCFEHAHDGCTMVSVGRRTKADQNANSNSTRFQDKKQPSSRWFKKNNQYGKGASPILEDYISGTKAQNRSPRTVLDGLEGQSNSTEDDTFSTRVSSTTNTPSSDSKRRSKIRKPQFPFRFIVSFLASPFRSKNFSISKNEKRQPLLKCFSYEQISNATKDFHQDNLVGRGGYSEVYKGDLSDGRTIAVKRLAKDNKDPNKEKEFLMELGVIGHVCHPNTATLVGCCIENGLYLIFNYSQNGNLATALHGKAGDPLDWPIRYKIAIGVARGLHYLHKCCKHRIIHRDIKASNVLLGPDYEPQAKPLMESGNIAELADPRLEGKYDGEQLYRVVLTASYCVRQTATWRPPMSEVLELLTSGQESEVGKSWRIPKFTSDELDDYSMVFGYDVPSDVSLEDYL
ncbi:hypothetical protein JHK84_036177 [Glycine max]|nr:hypothetical protein JHK85_036498 [Glycine max]KAG5129780.1 hypothetical protein JHK84_036177 [Glycine max]